MEFLEPRRLLTTFHGSGNDVTPNTFEFQDAGGTIERINFFGNITAEVIGANITDQNTVNLVNLPGTYNGTPINGGIGSASGIQAIGTTGISDPNFPSGTHDFPAAKVQAIATDSSGNTYYLYAGAVTVGAATQNVLDIAKVDPTTGAATVIADINAATLTASGGAFASTGTITAVVGAAFNPLNGNLYFVATGGTPVTDKLFSVNVNASTAAAIQASVVGITGTFGGKTIGPIAFQQTSATTAVLYAIDNTGVTIGGKVDPQIFVVNQAGTDTIGTETPITIGGKPINIPITGMAFDGTTLYALASNTVNSAELTIDPATGIAVSLGALPANNSALGQNPGGLTFDPALTDPFTGQHGALLGTDTGTSTLFYLDPASRAQRLSIFSIYISQSDSTGEITIADTPPLNVSPRPMLPYSGSVTLDVLNNQSGQLQNITGGLGGVLLGARTLQVNPGIKIFNEPILSAPVQGSFGVLPSSITTLFSGVQMAPGQQLGEFFLGGTLLGQVNLQGSVGTFYAGWLLTGNGNGEFGTGEVTYPSNFTVNGDIRKLIVGTSIGTFSAANLLNDNYLSGFDMSVSGTIGLVQAYGSIAGSINAEHLPTTSGLNTNQTKTQIYGVNDPWDSGIFGGLPQANTESFTSPQYLSSSPNAIYSLTNGIVVDGTLQNDTQANNGVDYYAVPLMAGQTITVQVQETTPGSLKDLLDLGVFDPQGNEIATDYNKTAQFFTQEGAIQFTTKQAGVYRFAVSQFNDPLFTGSEAKFGDIPYELVIKNVGDTGIGAIVATSNIIDDAAVGNFGFGTVNGDFGAVVSGGVYTSPAIAATSIGVERGNLRVIQAGSIGVAAGAELGVSSSPGVTVPSGSVGLVQSTAGDLFLNEGGSTPPAIGGDYQIVSSAANFAANLIANGNIGTIRMATLTNLQVSLFHVDANAQSNAGRIDLIDDAGDFGTLSSGGPRIITGPRGNVRYIHVLGTVYQDAVFGGGAPTNTKYDPGVAASLTDDSGSTVSITPTPFQTVTDTVYAKGTKPPAVTVPQQDVNTTVFTTSSTVTVISIGTDGTTTTTITTTGNPDSLGRTTRTVTVETPASLDVTAYGIEGSGGSAIVKVVSSGGAQINSSGSGAEIGSISTTGTGTNPVPQPTTIVVGGTTKNPTTTTIVSGTTTTTSGTTSNKNKTGQLVTIPSPPVLLTNGTFLNVSIGGSPTSAFSITAGGTIDNLTNSSGGEIVSLSVGGLGNFSSNGPVGTGFGKSTAADIMPQAAATKTYPFNGQHNTISVTGDAVSISAPTLGNVIVGGQVGTLSGTIKGPVQIGGALNYANIGAGISPSGSGNGADAGLFVTGAIGTVSNSQPADIRGDIVSSTGIQSIQLHNGSIIDSVIGNLTTFNFASALFGGTLVIVSGGGTFSNPVYDIGSISTSGNGGMIGDLIAGTKIQSISSRGGFGIFATAIATNGQGTIQSLTADGYGLRGVYFAGGLNAGSIAAVGNGTLISAGSISGSVRYSENSLVDPNFNFAPNPYTDIDTYLTYFSGKLVSATTPVVPGVTDSGIIEDSTFVGSRTLGSISAYQIRKSANGIVTTINFAEGIGSITTASQINGLSVTTGKLGTFAPGGDVSNTNLTIAGKIGKIVLRSNLIHGSSITASGPNGDIGSISIAGSMDGTIQAQGGKIQSVRIGNNFFGNIKSNYLGSLSVGGSLGNGSLSISGNVGSITIAGNLGQPGDVLNVAGKLQTLKVGGNLNANVNVGSSLTNLLVAGSIVSGVKVTVGDVLSLLKVGGDFQAGATIQAHKVKTRKISGLAAGTIVIV